MKTSLLKCFRFSLFLINHRISPLAIKYKFNPAYFTESSVLSLFIQKVEVPQNLFVKLRLDPSKKTCKIHYLELFFFLRFFINFIEGRKNMGRFFTKLFPIWNWLPARFDFFIRLIF